MRIAALYDIHGNLPALEAVLDDVRRAEVDEIVVGGDVVPGPMPRQTLERLLELAMPVRFIRGNGDREVAAWMEGVEPKTIPERYREIIWWAAWELGLAHCRVLASWPATLTLDVPRVGEVLFCHATPRSDTSVFTRRTSDERLERLFDGIDAPLVVCGHTHMQLDRTIGRTRIVNAGSVGMPFGVPGAYWLLIDHEVELRRTGYDVATAASRIRATSYPHAEEFAARNVLRPPTEESMLEAFAAVESR